MTKTKQKSSELKDLFLEEFPRLAFIGQNLLQEDKKFVHEKLGMTSTQWTYHIKGLAHYPLSYRQVIDLSEYTGIKPELISKIYEQ